MNKTKVFDLRKQKHFCSHFSTSSPKPNISHFPIRIVSDCQLKCPVLFDSMVPIVSPLPLTALEILNSVCLI